MFCFLTEWTNIHSKGALAHDHDPNLLWLLSERNQSQNGCAERVFDSEVKNREKIPLLLFFFVNSAEQYWSDFYFFLFLQMQESILQEKAFLSYPYPLICIGIHFEVHASFKHLYKDI